MRHGAGRVFGYAVLASLVLHALVLFALPAARELRALVPPEVEPLIARVERLAPPPAPQPAPPPAAKPDAREPAAPARLHVLKPSPAVESHAQPASPKPAPPHPSPPPAPIAAAPPPPARAPATALDPAARSDYARRINEAAERFKVYPRVAIDNGWRGEVGLEMLIGADGGIAALRVSRSSGHKVLDEQALKMFARAKPEVRLPAALRGHAFALELRAVFRLDGRT